MFAWNICRVLRCWTSAASSTPGRPGRSSRGVMAGAESSQLWSPACWGVDGRVTGGVPVDRTRQCDAPQIAGQVGGLHASRQNQRRHNPRDALPMMVVRKRVCAATSAPTEPRIGIALMADSRPASPVAGRATSSAMNDHGQRPPVQADKVATASAAGIPDTTAPTPH